jgi:hypothetical protein
MSTTHPKSLGRTIHTLTPYSRSEYETINEIYISFGINFSVKTQRHANARCPRAPPSPVTTTTIKILLISTEQLYPDKLPHFSFLWLRDTGANDAINDKGEMEYGDFYLIEVYTSWS